MTTDAHEIAARLDPARVVEGGHGATGAMSAPVPDGGAAHGPGSAARTSRSALLCAAPAILLAVLVLLPFRNKAFTIDDTFFLLEARHALTDPLHPTAFDVAWSNLPGVVRASSVMVSGPVIAWLLMPAAHAGGAEWLAHLVQIAMMALALFATVALALRFGLGSRWAAGAGLLLAATPAALGMAGTAMPDVPAMALGIAGLERLVAWKQERRVHQAVLAALMLALAALTRSHLLFVLGIGALFLAGDFTNWSSWRKVGWITWLPLLAVVLLVSVVARITRDPAGSTADYLSAIKVLSSAQRVPTNAIAFALHWVFALPLALPWVLLRPAVLRRWGVILVVATAILYYHWGDKRWLLVMAVAAGLGAAVLWDILLDGWKRRDAVQLALGLWLLIPLTAVTYAHLPSKYLLACAPAVALLVARAMAARGGLAARLALGLTLLLGVSLGVAILRADTAFANLGRRAAAELIEPQVAAGKQVWFAGHWGFHWYAEKAGAHCLSATPPYPAQGDLIVSSRVSMGETIGMYPHRTLLASLSDHQPGGRLMDQALGAGFFSNGWGYLPWVWGDDLIDAFELWRVDDASPVLPDDGHRARSR